jgi:diacylglycerol kinase (ATP)
MGEAVCPRIIIAGGDGTVSWVVEEVTAAMAGRERQAPSFGILPYGTGNDLARALGSLDHDSSAATPLEALSLLRRLEQAPLRSVDRWQLRVSSVHTAPRIVRWSNYLSIGFDAGVALAFDAARRSAPSRLLFSTRLGNKAAYGLLGAWDFAMGSCRELAERVSLQCDGRDVPLPDGTCGLLLLNISSFMGGVTPWAADTASCPGDGLLEVVAHRGALHLASMQLGLEFGLPLGRAARVVVTTTAPFPAQADGEPWMQAAASVLEVSSHGTTQFAVPGGGDVK